MEFLQELGQALGITVESVSLVSSAKEGVSSTAIRQALQKPDLALADPVSARIFCPPLSWREIKEGAS